MTLLLSGILTTRSTPSFSSCLSWWFPPTISTTAWTPVWTRMMWSQHWARRSATPSSSPSSRSLCSASSSSSAYFSLSTGRPLLTPLTGRSSSGSLTSWRPTRVRICCCSCSTLSGRYWESFHCRPLSTAGAQNSEGERNCSGLKYLKFLSEI